MQLNSISIEPNAIVLKVSANQESGGTKELSETKITAEDAPLPEFTEAFSALRSVFCEIMECTDWEAGLSINGLSISRTKKGTRSVILYGKKQLECRADFLHPVQTPMVQIDEAADGESGPVKLSDTLSEVIGTAIHEAERYMNHERAQGSLNLKEAKDALNAVAKKGKKASAQPELIEA